MTEPTPQPTGVAPTGQVPPQPTGPAPTGTSDPRLSEVKIPEAYQKEAWAKEVKSVDDLWSKMAGAQKLLGKDKLVLPGQNATQEEIDMFHVKLGRPENVEGYEFKSVEELKDIERNTELDHSMKKIFFENGIPKTAGEKIVQEYEQLIYEQNKPLIDANAKRDIEFQKLTDEVLGEDKASAISSFKSVMREALGDKAYLADKLESLSNDELIPLIVLGKNLHDKYAGESTPISRKKSGGDMTGDIKSDFQTLSSQKIAIKTDPNIPEHIKKMRLANINIKMMKIGNKASSANIDLFK